MLHLGIQGSYREFEITLFDGEGCLKTIKETGHASSVFLNVLQKLLDSCDQKFSDLKFISIDQGPGAFTSLRVMISYVNSFAFTKRIPLIGIDGLDAIAEETFALLKSKNSKLKDCYIAVLLNAYNKEIYNAIYRFESNGDFELISEKCHKKPEIFLKELSERFESEKVFFTGNGINLFKDLIHKYFNKNSIDDSCILETCSSEQVAKMGLNRFLKKENLSYELFPLYLKRQDFAVKK